MKTYIQQLSAAGFVLLFVLVTFCGCDGWKWDKNGDLDGMWQMTEWRDNVADAVVATKERGFYYCVQLQLIKFQDIHAGSYHLAYFTHTPDSLIIGYSIRYPADTVSTMSELAKYGVPADGHFHVDALTNSHMVLRSRQATLTFRKY